jgi:septum formation protein
MRLILASGSPRRLELLRAAGLACVVSPADVDETPIAGEEPAVYVERLARAKAQAGLARYPDDAVLGADTTVVIDRRILGKPSTQEEAEDMLRRLSGRQHLVLTGVAIAVAGAQLASVERTTVWMSSLTDDDIAWYVGSGEPLDRAGAYAIQGLASRFIPRIDGSYSNVVGLPVAAVLQLLKEAGLGVLATAGPGRGTVEG